MLLAIIMLYKCTQFILKSANQGVRQGSSTSSVLFNIICGQNGSDDKID